MSRTIIRKIYTRALIPAWLFVGLFSCVTGCVDSSVSQDAQAARNLEELTGDAHVRIVWVQDAWTLNDVFTDRGRLRLMGLDSRDQRGERVIIDGPAPLRKPLLTPCGQTIVYTDSSDDTVMAIDWEGQARRELTTGTGLAVWRDPQTREVWVYAGRDKTEEEAHAFRKIVRVMLEDPRQEELVWDAAPVGRDNFQLSADGRRAAGMFPWPDCGVADLSEGQWSRKGRGCWPLMAPDNSYRMGFMDGAHRNLTLVDLRSGDRRRISLAGAPGIGGHEVYHPRWSRHPRFMVITGPYEIRHGGNNIRGGGESVEIHLGRFSEDYHLIEKWVQATDNRYANFYPDVWIDFAPDESDAGETALLDKANESLADSDGHEKIPTFRVVARLEELAPIPDPEDILPYDRALVANKYVVEKVLEGSMPDENILAAHWVIRDGQRLPGAAREEGRSYTMYLQDYQQRSDLEGERLAKDVDDLLLPLYYDMGQ